MRKIPLRRYRTDSIPRREMENAVLMDAHRDYRGSNRTILTGALSGGTQLVSISDLPDAELERLYVLSLRKTLQRCARAQDLSLYELNPDDPAGSVLFADTEILFRTRSGWTLGYVQPSNFDEHEIMKASKYAQVVAAMHKDVPSSELVAVLQNPLTYRVWKKLEQAGRVVRDADGNVTVLGE
jgi:hypothetical protein